MTDWSTTPQPVGESRWSFPPPDRWPDSDLIAVGGDLEPATLVNAYRRGIFPMEVTALQGKLGWWSPEPRGIVPLDRLRVTKSMRQSAKRFEVRVDTCFVDVMRACGDPSREDGWITGEFVAAYTTLHRAGVGAQRRGVRSRGPAGRRPVRRARSNGLFAGESMFHAQRDASKVALMALVRVDARERHAAARRAVVHDASGVARRD